MSTPSRPAGPPPPSELGDAPAPTGPPAPPGELPAVRRVTLEDDRPHPSWPEPEPDTGTPAPEPEPMVGTDDVAPEGSPPDQPGPVPATDESEPPDPADRLDGPNQADQPDGGDQTDQGDRSARSEQADAPAGPARADASDGPPPEEPRPAADPVRPEPPELERPRILSRWLRAPIHTLAFVRKEIIAVLRQPRLLAVLVIGPFLLLFLFGVGYDQESSVLRTRFIGPEGSIYETAVDRFTEDLEAYVINAGYSSDPVEARDLLLDDEIDLVVMFPPDPSETVLDGEQAVITVLHDKLDPIQQTAVNVSAQVAVQELNSMVLEQVVGDVQTTVRPYEDSIDSSITLLDDLETAARLADQEETRRLTAELDQEAAGLRAVVESTRSVRASLGSDLAEEEQAQVDRLLDSIDAYQASTGDLVTASEDLDPAEVRQTREALEQVQSEGETVITLDPAVAVRPFRSDAESLLRDQVTVNDFFAPAAIALLVQHMALTFAALGLVSDRSLGLFELFRVGSIRSGRILLGKYLAHLVLGGAVAAALLTATVTLLGVPLRGEWWWVAATMAGVVTASIAGGMVLSLLARNESQAVQYAMLALLAGLFFGGFLLELDAIRFPVKALSYLLPVTYGTTLLRDIMLRGAEPEILDLAGLVATSLAYGVLAWWLMARRMRLR